MKKSIIVALAIFLFLGLGCSKKEKATIKINEIEITSREFNDAFQSSNFAKEGESARKNFLEIFISRKLMLKEAEKLGLDKDPEFLKDIQLFWEQSLLKLLLSKKINELSINIKVDDKEVNDYYLKNKEESFADKELSQVYDQIKWLLFRVKQARVIQEWADSLKDKAKIDINYKLLGIENN